MRLYGMMQHLMARYAAREVPDTPVPRRVVEEQDALDAVLQIAAVLDEQTQARAIPVERAAHAGAMLMLLRDHVRALPPGPDLDGHDRVTADLRALVEGLRQLRHQTGHHA